MGRSMNGFSGPKSLRDFQETGSSFLNMRADHSSKLADQFPKPLCLTIASAKCPKMAILRHLLKFVFKNIWINLRLFCTVQIKDSCIVDIENRRF